MSESLVREDLPAKPKSPLATSTTSRPTYQFTDLKYSITVLGILIFDSFAGLLHYFRFESWETTDWGERAILIVGAACFIALPFQLRNTIHVLRHYGREPYRWKDFWLTVGALVVGAGFVLAGLFTYARMEAGSELSLVDAFLLGSGVYFSVILLLGIPYACFLLSRLG